MLARDLHLLPVFAAVVRHGSFTGAAEELRVAKSVVSRNVRLLEERCGARLIDRTTRRLRVTQLGAQVHAAATVVVGAAGDVDRIVAAHQSAPTGTLRVTAPNDLGGMLVAPVVAEVARLYPALCVEIELDDRRRDLVGEGFDVALRLGPIHDSGQIVRRLGWDHEVVVAAPALAAAYGRPDHPTALQDAPWIVHSGIAFGKDLALRSREGKEARVSVTRRALVNDAESMRALARASVGFTLFPRHTAAVDLAAGRLEVVCPGWYYRRITLHALLPGRRPPPRVTLFLDRLAAIVPTFGFKTGKG